MARKRLSFSKTEQRAKARFCRWIRAAWANEYGYITCVTCGTSGLWHGGGMHAGHYIHRRRIVYFCPMNVHPQCATCNRNDGMPKTYTNWMDRYYGVDNVAWLLKYAEQWHEYTREELDRIYEESTENIKALGFSPY